MVRHNEHVISMMVIDYNYLWDIYKRHCLKPEFGGFKKSGAEERLSCRLAIDDLDKKIGDERRAI